MENLRTENYLNDLRYSENYETLRRIGDKYFELKLEDYITQYYIWLIEVINLNFIEPHTTEKDFLMYQLIELLDRNEDKKGKNKKPSLEEEIVSSKKFHFIYMKLEKLEQSSKVVNLEEYVQQIKQTRKTKINELEGKTLNLMERFKIANEILDVEKRIRKLKISENEKHILLGYIMGCNEDNAKKIMNGNYDAKIKEDLLTKYIDNLHR
ncbi:MAG: hypothetical protein QNK20_13755 [Aureibaculum sp.]|nr:hypothetical protein [Aureibaculum sp.]